MRGINIFEVSKLKTFVYLFSFLIRFLELFVFHEYINTSCLDLFSFVRDKRVTHLLYIITRNIFIDLKISFNRYGKSDTILLVGYIFFLFQIVFYIFSS